MVKRAVFILLLWTVACPAFGFALLGPYDSWMTWSNGYRNSDDLGGPMQIGEEYRWNLPVITYGFDPEFIAYFGKEGVAAVESAIATLTNLPPFSETDLEAYALHTLLQNSEARALYLRDLKSSTLQWLLHQLGLAQPARYIATIRERTVDSASVIHRNYSPDNLAPTNSVNGVAYDYRVYFWTNGSADAVEILLDPLAMFPFSAVADHSLEMAGFYNNGVGRFYTGLTRDDVGGLRYLYSHTNINIEPLPTGVTVVGGTNRPAPDIAPRPGMDKLSFMPMTWDANAGRFNSVTSVFDVIYVTNGITETQAVQRIVTGPDILFEARDLGGRRLRTSDGMYAFAPEVLKGSDTTHWQNLSQLNNGSSGGPGLILPGARLTFSKVDRYAELGSSTPCAWGSFDETANEPFIYRGDERATTVTLDYYIQREGTNSYLTTVFLGTVGAVYQIESSTSLITWAPFATITNDSSPELSYSGYFSFRDAVTEPKKFYRAIRQ